MASTNANPLSAKLTKLLSSSLDDPKLRTSLSALSEFYAVNAVNSRHNLRGDIERRGTEVNYEFLRELEKVNIVSAGAARKQATFSGPEVFCVGSALERNAVVQSRPVPSQPSRRPISV